MHITVITPPEPVITLEEAKTHLRLDDDDNDIYVSGLIEAATAWLDGPDGWLGRALGVQTLEGVFPVYYPQCSVYPSIVDEPARRYPYPPFRELVSETPSASGRSTTVRWKAGYVDGKIPAPIKHAILLMVSHMFNNRDAVTSTAAQPATLPLGVEALLAPFRVWSI